MVGFSSKSQAIVRDSKEVTARAAWENCWHDSCNQKCTDACSTQLTFSFSFRQGPNLRNSKTALPAFSLGLPTSVKGIKTTTPQTAPRPKLSRRLLTESLFWCDSNCVKLTNKPSHHGINIFIVYSPTHLFID